MLKRNFLFSILFANLALCLLSCSQEEPGALLPGNGLSSSSGSSISCTPSSRNFSRAHFVNQKLGRGVNLGNALDAQCRSWDTDRCLPYNAPLNAPQQGDGSWDDCWGNSIKDYYYADLRSSGFESIRLPVRWAEKASDIYPFTIPQSFKTRVKAVVDRAIAEGFPVILNIHHYNELYDDSGCRSDFDLQKQKFVELWRQIADEYKNYSDDFLIFEILNEGRSKVTRSELNGLLKDVWPIIRGTNPNRTIMINSSNWGKYSDLPGIDIPDNDSNVILSGHYYEPQCFTHYGDCGDKNISSWGSDKDRDSVEAQILRTYNRLKCLYADTETDGTIPVNIGEFGARDKWTVNGNTVVLNGRTDYIATVREEFEKHGFSWHYWAYPSAGPFSYDQQVLKALIPQQQP
jgi:endoglucanase